MSRRYIYPINKDYDYFNLDNFRTSKLEGTVELKMAGLPGVDSYIVSPKVYIDFKKEGTLPKSFEKELGKVVNYLVDEFDIVTVRTCFRFSGYENPRSLPAFRDLTSVDEVKKGVKDAFKAGEKFARDNEIDWFELGLILIGGIKADRAAIVIADPVTETCIIESCIGDIHLIAVGEDALDSYWLNGELKIVRKKIRDKKHGYYFKDNVREKRKIQKKRVKDQCLSDKEIRFLAENAFEAAKYTESTVEIEVMINKDGFADMYEMHEKKDFRLNLPKEDDDKDEALVSGVSVHGKKVDGKVKIVKSLDEVERVQTGAVLVIPEKLMGEDIPTLSKIRALITDTGGITAHISTIAKECDVPCIVGTKNASKVLTDGMRVVVDAENGKVYPYSKDLVDSREGHVVWLDGLKANLDLIGAKAYNLIALMQLGIDVPDAFIVTTEAFKKYIEQNKIQEFIDEKYTNIDVEELGELEQEVAEKIMDGKIQKDLEVQIFSAFKKLKKRYGSVSVRSSATCEDSLKASFAGQFQSFLFVDDKKTLIKSLKRCWASLFRAGAVLYATSHGINIKEVKMGVLIQGMIKADSAGVMFTRNISGDEDTMLIEASSGVGENVVSGSVIPTNYVLDKKTFKILSKKGENEDILPTSTVTKLVSLGLKIENAFEKPQDIEWAIEDKKIYLLQTRPITT